jgi:hypothetical protein
MERAQQQASARDPSNFSGKKLLHNLNLLSLSHDSVVRRVAIPGLSLGRTNSQIIHSVNLFKEMDVARNLFTLKRNDEFLSENKDDHCSVLLEEANKLSQDLLDEENAETETRKEIQCHS